MDEEPPFEHTIGPTGSFALIINNLTGPAMLGFPNLFQSAGIVPVTISIVFAWVASSLCGTLMADAIASIRGNGDFSQQVDFSKAFRLIVGKDWYVVAEALFLCSCAVQACASIVAAAQSLDGFIASFLFGKTAALQLFPTISIISWDTSNCHEESEFAAESNMEDCTPFHDAGPLVLTAGFLLVTLLFLPLGLGHLKETIAVQIFSMGCMVVLLVQFTYEFARRGLSFHLPWVGNELSQLAGVVLFNYAFSITVPSWLSEKDQSVSVNKAVWSASTAASAIYIIFGITGAMAFEGVGSNILIVLASNKVHHLTRFCAALFGVTIIGCGVPVFAVIIRTGLIASGLCSPRWALFLGGCAPFLFSWTLYQGTLLMSILNWAGLIINGLVAFLLPMVLALKAIELKARTPRDIQLTVQPHAPVMTSIETSPFLSLHSPSEVVDVEGNQLPASVTRKRIGSMDESKSDDSGHAHNGFSNGHSAASDLMLSADTSMTVDDMASTDSYMDAVHGTLKRLKANTVVEPLPDFMEAYRREIVVFMIASFTVIILTTIVEDAINGVLTPNVIN